MSLLTVFPRFFPHHLIKIGGNVLNGRHRKGCCSFSNDRSVREYCKMPVAEQKSLTLKYTKAHPDACPPTKGSLKAAGYDLKSAVDITVPCRGKALVDTGLKIELPEGCYGRVAPRSGLAVKNFIDVGAGVIDEDYRGVLKVVLFNHSDDDFQINKGDRIAQLICEKIYYPDLQEVEELSDTVRGDGGFGSTGTN